MFLTNKLNDIRIIDLLLVVIFFFILGIFISRMIKKIKIIDDMLIPKYNTNLYISESKIENAGQGVYSKVDIPKDTIIEVAHVLKLDSNKSKEPPLIDYVFSHPYNKKYALLVLGLGSIYNHSDNPNILSNYDPIQNKMYYYALKDIKADEELYIYYGNEWWNNRKKN